MISTPPSSFAPIPTCRLRHGLANSCRPSWVLQAIHLQCARALLSAILSASSDTPSVCACTLVGHLECFKRYTQCARALVGHLECFKRYTQCARALLSAILSATGFFLSLEDLISFYWIVFIITYLLDELSITFSWNLNFWTIINSELTGLPAFVGCFPF